MADEQSYMGIPASEGLARGPAAALRAAATGSRQPGSVEEETTALNNAIVKSRADLRHIAENADELAAEILEFQDALLEDDDLIEPVFEAIRSGQPADTAWGQKLNAEIADYQSADDEYMAARANDLMDTRDRVLAHLTGTETASRPFPEHAILFGQDLTPSRFLELDWHHLGGLVLSGGSTTSHVAILARARGIPMLVGAELPPDKADGNPALLDAENGRITIQPCAQTLAAFDTRFAQRQSEATRLAEIQIRPARTADGATISVLINVDDPALLDDLDPAICDGIGLTRTEFLFENGPPGEDTQLAAYTKILKWSQGRPVTIRTLDAGGDKPIAGITIDGELNPFLGVRGIRLSLSRPGPFRTQLRALCRAAATGPLKVMIPMVSDPSELEAARSHLDSVLDELKTEGTPSARPELGMMVETPAAALQCDAFGADFYSLGTNDLAQYVVAAARDNPSLAHLTQAADPAVLKLIALVATTGAAQNKPVSVCGDLASQPDKISGLIKAGIRSLSVAPAQVGRVKHAISQVRLQ